MDNKQTVHYFPLSSPKPVKIDCEQISVMCPSQILELSYEEKFQLAQHPNTSQETLAILATDKDSWVRFWVARHPNTSQESLAVLATDKHPYVRYWVARHPNTSDEILFFLLEDRDFYVAYSVRENPNVKELMRRLILMRMNEFL